MTVAASMTSSAGCDLCGATEHEPFAVKYGLAYLRCRACGFVFTNRAGFDFAGFNEEIIEDLHDTHAAKRTASRHVRAYRQSLAEFAPYRQTGRLLEIGCATGSFLSQARDSGWQTFGVEPVESSARHAIDHLGLDVHVGTLETASFESGSFDVIYSNAVLEHVPSPAAVLACATRLLRPGGLFYADTVNLQSYTWRFLGERWKLFDPRMHLNLFTPQTLRACCEGAGLEVRRTTTHGVRFTATREDRPRGWRRLADEFRKLPYSIAARWTLMGDNMTVYAVKPERAQAAAVR
jgi:SAM-dependent methyltransferase